MIYIYYVQTLWEPEMKQISNVGTLASVERLHEPRARLTASDHPRATVKQPFGPIFWSPPDSRSASSKTASTRPSTGRGPAIDWTTPCSTVTATSPRSASPRTAASAMPHRVCKVGLRRFLKLRFQLQLRILRIYYSYRFLANQTPGIVQITESAWRTL